MAFKRAYNRKINSDGSYRDFYGWTIVSNLANNMNYIEEYIRNNPILSDHFSALPSSSYHVTLYNIWSNHGKLLNPQQDYIDREHRDDIREQLIQRSISPGWFNPGNCMRDMFVKLKNHCDKQIDFDSLRINKVYCGNTIGLTFYHSHDFERLAKTRSEFITIAERDDRMARFHMTLAYKYKDTTEEDDEKIKKEIDKLCEILVGRLAVLYPCNLCYFESMESFIPFNP